MINAQSQLLQAGGAVLGAALAAGKIKEGTELSKEKGLSAEEQFHEAKADIATLTGESAQAGIKVDAAKNALGRTKEGSEANKKRMGELEAAQTAFNQLQEKIAAKQAMKQRAELIMKRTGVGGKK